DVSACWMRLASDSTQKLYDWTLISISSTCTILKMFVRPSLNTHTAISVAISKTFLPLEEDFGAIFHTVALKLSSLLCVLPPKQRKSKSSRLRSSYTGLIAKNTVNRLGSTLVSGTRARKSLWNDIIEVDRGFRDVVKYLEQLGFKVLMPALKGKRNQLTTIESNQSRFVTKIRWVVEAVHGDIKQKFKVLDHQLDNTLLPKVHFFCRVACFLHNEFGARLDSDVDFSEKVVDATNSKKHLDNTLASEVETNRWARRNVLFNTITSHDLTDFPELTERELKIFFTGSYQ
ncbi:hypothetical protein PV328_012114, partial [Microctonus aethiopoides]